HIVTCSKLYYNELTQVLLLIFHYNIILKVYILIVQESENIMNIQKIPQTELKVMKFIWNKNDIVTSKEVTKAMELEYGWKITTTLAILSRLVIRRFLTSERIGRITHYTTLIAKKDYKISETKRFLNDIHSNSLESLLNSLKDCNITHKKKYTSINNITYTSVLFLYVINLIIFQAYVNTYVYSFQFRLI
ncbi:BlaI/MecI/CopY family transcriptional regulator, partial [Clostridioides difficile]